MQLLKHPPSQLHTRLPPPISTHRASLLNASRHVVVVQGHHVPRLALEGARPPAVVQVDGGQHHAVEGVVQHTLDQLLVRVAGGAPAAGALELGAVGRVQVVVSPVGRGRVGLGGCEVGGAECRGGEERAGQGRAGGSNRSRRPSVQDSWAAGQPPQHVSGCEPLHHPAGSPVGVDVLGGLGMAAIAAIGGAVGWRC